MGAFHSCGPSEAMVVSGCCIDNSKIVAGGRVWVWTCFQTMSKISLNVMTLNIDSPKVYTKAGVAISVTGVAQVKIEGQFDEMLRNACQQFLGKTPHQIHQISLETLEGHQRAIMGTMTVEEIYQDRKKFAEAVFQFASTDLSNMGITIVSYTIKDVRDDEGYLDALGMKRTAEVKRDAAIGEAEAKRDAGILQARAEQARMAAKLLNDTAVAQSQRDFQLKKAAYDAEVNTKKADEELAYELQAAKTKQQIREEQIQVEVIERKKQIEVQVQEIARKEKELEAQVRRPALAEKYRLETIAEANKNKVILEAEARAEAIRARGEAEAFAIQAKAKAEAEQMAKKADAWKEYGDAAMVDMLLSTLPRIAAEIAAPLTETSRIVMVSGGNGPVGAAKLTGEVLEIMQSLPDVVNKLTGVDISKSISRGSAEASITLTGRRQSTQA
eukprot:Opistho-2@40876